MESFKQVLDVIGSLEEIMASELDNLKPVNLLTFGPLTENYEPKGQVLFNMTNLVCTERADFDYYRYYAKSEDLVAELTFPTYNLNLFVLSHINSTIITNALKG